MPTLGFNFKSFDGLSVHVQNLNKLIELTKPLQIMPAFSKPDNELVRREHLPKSTKIKLEKRATLEGQCPPVAVGGECKAEEQEAIRGVGAATIPSHQPFPPTAPLKGQCPPMAVGKECKAEERKAINGVGAAATPSHQPFPPAAAANTEKSTWPEKKD